MTITRIGTDSVSETPNTQTNSSLQVTHASTPQLGDLVIMEAVLLAYGTGTTNDFNLPAGWTLVGSSFDAGTPSHRLSVFQKIWADGDSLPNMTWPNQSQSVIITKIRRGVKGTTPIHQSSVVVHSGSGTARTSGTITTTINSVVEYAFSDRSGSTYTKGTGTDDTLATITHTSSSSLASFAIPGEVAAGSYSRTATASVSTSIGGSAIYALTPLLPDVFEGWGVPI